MASIGDAKNFENGRQLATWLGLVPRQHSSGGKSVLLGISKRGDTYLRTLLIHGARAVKRITKPILGFNSFQSAKSILAGIELMHMIRKGQLNFAGSEEMSFANQFYALAGKISIEKITKAFICVAEQK